MSETKIMLKRRRRGIGALTMLFGGLMAIGSLFFAVTGASANQVGFNPGRLCDGSWSATASYFDGSDYRLVILSGVTINGVPLSASQTAGFVPYNPAVHGVTEPPTTGGLAWLGTSDDFTIFSLSGSNYNSNWSGVMTVFRPIGDIWFVGHSTSVYPPSGPTDCAPNTPTPTNTTPPTATATATVVDNSTPTPTVPSNTPTPTNTVPSNTPTPTTTVPSNTPTPTKTVPVNTPTPTKTVPPCTPPGTQTPTGGTTCTPTPTVPASTATPTNTVPATATRTTPPCTPPGSGQTPTGGSVVCTPTIPPATNTAPPSGCYNGGGNPPSGAVVCTPTPVDSVAGVRTPGPGVPSAGTGFTGDISNTNMVFALLGLLAVTAGAAFMAIGRREEEE